MPAVVYARIACPTGVFASGEVVVVDDEGNEHRVCARKVTWSLESGELAVATIEVDVAAAEVLAQKVEFVIKEQP